MLIASHATGDKISKYIYYPNHEGIIFIFAAQKDACEPCHSEGFIGIDTLT